MISKTDMKRHPFLVLFGALFGSILLVCVLASRGPNFDVTWERHVPSTQTPAEIGTALDDLKMWPVYYHGLKEVKFGAKEGTSEAALSSQPSKPQTDPVAQTKSPRLSSGDILEIKIEQVQKEWKRFSLTTRVNQYEPGKFISFELLGDSKDKITQMFSDLAWDVRVGPIDPSTTQTPKTAHYKSLITGTAHARTANWRGRMFGRIAPKILMNQVYMIDLVKLGTLERQAAAKKDNLPPSYQ